MANELEIIVLKYDVDFTKRSKDIKKNTWFSFPNDLLLHPDFTEIGGEELKWFIWIVSICSKLNQSKIRINIPHAEKVLTLKRVHLFSMVEKLQGKQIDVVCGQMATDGDLNATARDQSAAPTLHYITLQTLHNTTNKHNNISAEPTKSVPAVVKNKVSFKISETKQVGINSDLVQSWAETYPKEFLEISFKEMRNWVLSNEHKAPKSQWAKFMNGWFKRGFEQYRKTLKSNPSKITIDDLNDILGGAL